MRTSKAKLEFRKIAHLIERSEMMVLPKLNNKGLQLSRLERTPDKREVGGSSPLKPSIEITSAYSFGEDERCWSSNLQISLLRQKALTMMYLENCIPNEKLYKYFIIRHPRILIERLIFLNNKNKFLNIVYDTRQCHT